MQFQFKLGDKVEYFEDPNWIDAEIEELDLEDPEKPYKIIVGPFHRWVKEEEVREKRKTEEQDKSITQFPLKVKSNKKCPLCGRDGIEGWVTLFYCNNANCTNYYDRNK